MRAQGGPTWGWGWGWGFAQTGRVCGGTPLGATLGCAHWQSWEWAVCVHKLAPQGVGGGRGCLCTEWVCVGHTTGATPLGPPHWGHPTRATPMVARVLVQPGQCRHRVGVGSLFTVWHHSWVGGGVQSGCVWGTPLGAHHWMRACWCNQGSADTDLGWAVCVRKLAQNGCVRVGAPLWAPLGARIWVHPWVAFVAACAHACPRARARARGRTRVHAGARTRVHAGAARVPVGACTRAWVHTRACGLPSVAFANRQPSTPGGKASCQVWA